MMRALLLTLSLGLVPSLALAQSAPSPGFKSVTVTDTLTAKNVATKTSPTINVLAYGAKGDGSTPTLGQVATLALSALQRVTAADLVVLLKALPAVLPQAPTPGTLPSGVQVGDPYYDNGTLCWVQP